MPKKSESQPSRVGPALDATNVVLTTVKEAARMAPVPYLQEAATLALGLLEAVQVREPFDVTGAAIELVA